MIWKELIVVLGLLISLILFKKASATLNIGKINLLQHYRLFHKSCQLLQQVLAQRCMHIGIINFRHPYILLCQNCS